MWQKTALWCLINEEINNCSAALWLSLKCVSDGLERSTFLKERLLKTNYASKESDAVFCVLIKYNYGCKKEWHKKSINSQNRTAKKTNHNPWNSSRTAFDFYFFPALNSFWFPQADRPRWKWMPPQTWFKRRTAYIFHFFLLIKSNWENDTNRRPSSATMGNPATIMSSFFTVITQTQSL